MEKTPLKLVSNVILKSKYIKDPYSYIPYDLLPSTYSDARAQHMLSEFQRQQKLKRLFWTELIKETENNE